MKRAAAKLAVCKLGLMGVEIQWVKDENEGVYD